jgi:SAM-dependent methyltransferase
MKNKNIEQEFHDNWANNADISIIDIKKSNEVCTAPEMRFISKRLGDIHGKKLLDIGCGLGEASVYFASIGAVVTSTDLSPGMLNATYNLAKINNLKVKKHLSSAEDLKLGNKKFDIIYAGNLLHHVDVEKTILNIKNHLNQDGVFVSWDPLHYNPLINVYRLIASDVRTPDEHPLKFSDIKIIEKNFQNVEKKFFWFFTLIIFILMLVFQRKNPNKERFWKVVVRDGDFWKWLYLPLEFLDKLILFLFPPLRWLCWNVVVIARKK